MESSDKLRTRLVTYKLNGEVQSYLLGPHAPTLTSDDLDLIHKLWLEAVAEVGIEVHHRDVVRVALEKLRREMQGGKRSEAMDMIRRQADESPMTPPSPDPTSARSAEVSADPAPELGHGR